MDAFDKEFTASSVRADELQLLSDVLPRTHGSALFTRGETQAICTTTLGTKDAEQMIDDLENELGVKVSTSQSAQIKAARALGSKKMVVAHPYEEKDTTRISSYNEHMHCETLGAMAFGCATFLAFSHYPDRKSVV